MLLLELSSAAVFVIDRIWHCVEYLKMWGEQILKEVERNRMKGTTRGSLDRKELTPRQNEDGRGGRMDDHGYWERLREI